MNFIKNLFRGDYWLAAIDNSPLIIFRIVFGLVVAADAFGGMAVGWTYEAFVEPQFTFNFIGLDFLQVFVGTQMYVLYTLFGVCGLLIAFGAFYRSSTILAALLWTIIYFTQKTHYNNHYYLLMLLCWFMALVPANQYFSVDVRRKPSLKSDVAPRWATLTLVVLLWIVYTYASIAKMYAGWVNGEPMKAWFAQKINYPLIGEWLQSENLHLSLAWGGIFFDMLVVPLLLWRRTRWLGVAASVGFHLFNSVVFQIGTFPYLMLGSLVLFFEPEKVRDLFFKQKNKIPPLWVVPKMGQRERLILFAISLFFVVQIALPLRHYFFEGDVLWTEEGHRYSWRMMLRNKTGTLSLYVVRNDKGVREQINLPQYLTSKQIGSVTTRPDMLWQFVQILKKDYARRGITDISIFADCKASINDSAPQIFIDPNRDLAKVEWHHFRHSDWIMPQQRKE